MQRPLQGGLTGNHARASRQLAHQLQHRRVWSLAHQAFERLGHLAPNGSEVAAPTRPGRHASRLPVQPKNAADGGLRDAQQPGNPQIAQALLVEGPNNRLPQLLGVACPTLIPLIDMTSEVMSIELRVSGSNSPVAHRSTCSLQL